MGFNFHRRTFHQFAFKCFTYSRISQLLGNVERHCLLKRQKIKICNHLLNLFPTQMVDKMRMKSQSNNISSCIAGDGWERIEPVLNPGYQEFISTTRENWDKGM